MKHTFRLFFIFKGFERQIRTPKGVKLVISKDLLQKGALLKGKVWDTLKWVGGSKILSLLFPSFAHILQTQGVCQILDTEFPDFSLTFFCFSLTLRKHFLNFLLVPIHSKSEICLNIYSVS